MRAKHGRFLMPQTSAFSRLLTKDQSRGREAVMGHKRDAALKISREERSHWVIHVTRCE